MRNVKVKQKGKNDPEQSQSENERGRQTQRWWKGAVSWSADRSPEVVIYSIVSISQQQLQPSFFIPFHSLRTDRYFCPSEPNQHLYDDIMCSFFDIIAPNLDGYL